MKKQYISLIVVVLGVLLIVPAVLRTNKKALYGAVSDNAPVLVDKSALEALPTKDASGAITKRIDPSILPPTNSWISGMVLQETPMAVYPMPGSFLANDKGFEIGLPVVESSATSITGTHTAGLIANIEGSNGFKLSRYDKISATLTYLNDKEKAVGKLTIAQGVPYTFYRSIDESIISVPLGVVVGTPTDSYVRFTKQGNDYVVHSVGDSKISILDQVAHVKVPKKGLVTLYTLPTDTKDTLIEFAGNEITSVDTEYTHKNELATTVLDYHTENDGITVVSAIGYNKNANPSKTLMSYDTIYGKMYATSNSKLEITVPSIKSSDSLELSKISADHKAKLIERLKKDVEATSITSKDSYFAGKQLARAATLLDISEQLQQTETSSRLKVLLRTGFSSRLEPNYFYYDNRVRGVAAQNKAFGSEDFNDHHFHYGYFIYAAAIFGRYDKEFLTDNTSKINLLVADIASYNGSKDFPKYRNYDPYSGHSWAAGLAPFADGNNQESSSEALNAWNGVTKWAELTKNEPLRDVSSWMLSNEYAAAKSAWRNIDVDYKGAGNYSSPIVSLNFGGKRTYSTFFSDEASAKLGIQLLPMSPVMSGFADDKNTITNSVTKTIQNDNYNVPLGDYILMYSALSDPFKAETQLDAQSDAFIDDGNSRSYMHAWVYALIDKNK